jgi:uroporphyrinogen-III synthase
VSAQPLAGRRVLVTRARPQSEALCASIRAEGGRAVVIPAIRIEAASDRSALDRALGELERYDWLVFTSANAVEAFYSRIDALETEGSMGKGHGQVAAGARTAAVGPATAMALRRNSADPVCVPEDFASESIAEALGDVSGLHVLIPGSDIARENLGAALRGRGAVVDEVAAYVTAPGEMGPDGVKELERGFDAVIFMSPSAARNFAALADGPERLGGAVVACIGPATAEEAERCGYRVGLVAEVHSSKGVIDALVRHFRDAATAPESNRRS